MAGRKGSRSSKTDHVLSLLSSGGKEEARPAAAAPPPGEGGVAQPEPAAVSQAEEQTDPAPDAVPEPVPAGPAAAAREGERLTAPILQVAKTNNEALSQTIRDALSQALEEDMAQQPPAPEPAVVPEGEAEAAPVLDTAPAPEAEASGPAPEPQPVPEAEAEPEPVPEPETEAAPVLDTAPVPEPETPGPVRAPDSVPASEPGIPFAPRETRLPDGAVCVNVMELLVDERLERYVKLFGLCDCPRCLADARALALTRLPPKYVVLSAMAATPMISLYRAKFESQVIAQVIQACKTVMESPRHAL